MFILITQTDMIVSFCVVALLCILMYAAGVQMGRRHPEQTPKHRPEDFLDL